MRWSCTPWPTMINAIAAVCEDIKWRDAAKGKKDSEGDLRLGPIHRRRNGWRRQSFPFTTGADRYDMTSAITVRRRIDREFIYSVRFCLRIRSSVRYIAGRHWKSPDIVITAVPVSRNGSGNRYLAHSGASCGFSRPDSNTDFQDGFPRIRKDTQ